MGDLAETVETWAESLAFWAKYGQKDMIFLGNLAPYPGSKLFEDCQSKGMFPDKHAYYEHIDEGVVNMTQIPGNTFKQLIELTSHLERGWLFVKESINVRAEMENFNVVKTWATCPHCGNESVYRQEIDGAKNGFHIGTACLHCNKRVKIVGVVK